MKRSTLLTTVIPVAAAELLAEELTDTGYSYTCHALRDAGAPADFVDLYWYVLMEDPAHKSSPRDCSTAEQRLEALGYHRCRGGKELQTRLMMLAWLHEMIRSGEFTKITGFKFVSK